MLKRFLIWPYLSRPMALERSMNVLNDARKWFCGNLAQYLFEKHCSSKYPRQKIPAILYLENLATLVCQKLGLFGHSLFRINVELSYECMRIKMLPCNCTNKSISKI